MNIEKVLPFLKSLYRNRTKRQISFFLILVIVSTIFFCYLGYIYNAPTEEQLLKYEKSLKSFEEEKSTKETILNELYGTVEEAQQNYDSYSTYCSSSIMMNIDPENCVFGVYSFGITAQIDANSIISLITNWLSNGDLADYIAETLNTPGIANYLHESIRVSTESGITNVVFYHYNLSQAEQILPLLVEGINHYSKTLYSLVGEFSINEVMNTTYIQALPEIIEWQNLRRSTLASYQNTLSNAIASYASQQEIFDQWVIESAPTSPEINNIALLILRYAIVGLLFGLVLFILLYYLKSQFVSENE